MQEDDDGHGIANVSEIAPLDRGEGEVDEDPADDAGTFVVEEFEVEEAAQSGVQLHADEEVGDDGAAVLAVAGEGGSDVAFHEDEK